MSDESDDENRSPRTSPTRKSAGRGPIPRSRELTSLLILLVGVRVIWFGGVSLARRLSGLFFAGLHFDHSIMNDPNLILGQIIPADQECHAGAAAAELAAWCWWRSFLRSCWEGWYQRQILAAEVFRTQPATGH